MKKGRTAVDDREDNVRIQEFLDMIAPSVIKFERGVCLYKCGNERYNLMVNAPEHKARLFGKAGGR